MKYPNLKNTKLIAIDSETKETNIKLLGPGYYRAKYNNEDSHILCVAVATKEKSWVFDYNEKTIAWLKDNSHLSVIGANIMYDLLWFNVSDDIKFNGKYYDILINESLIDGGRSYYNLDKCAEKYLGTGKGNDEIKDYCESKGWGGDPREHLYKMYQDPYGKNLVLNYNKSDAGQTFQIFENQIKIIEANHLQEVYELESNLISVLFKMKQIGVKIDVKRLEETAPKIKARIDLLQEEVDKIVGFKVNVAANASMEQAFKKLNLAYPYTEKGSPSFKSEFLENLDHPFGQKCHEIRALSKLQSTYIAGFEKFIINGRVYTDYHQVKNGSRGAITGRLSATQPALQTIPKKGEGKILARSLFIPEENCLWEKQDQSQEEYRIFAHYARGEGAEQLRYDFINDEKMDMHQWVTDFAKLKNRQTGKTLNFLSIYGGGLHKFALQAGLPIPPLWQDFNLISYQEQVRKFKEYEAGKIFFAYHEKLPCIKITAKAAEKACKQRGYAQTFLKRRRYFCNSEAWKSLNEVVQGTGGDLMKKWMVDCDKIGLWEILKLHLTLHDELDFSKPKTKEGEEAAKEVKRIGENCIKLKIPLRVDREEGPNWAEVKEL